jgi:uncharacterized protein YoxC
MNLIALTEKLIAERGYGDEMLANLTAMIDKDIDELGKRMDGLQHEMTALEAHRVDLLTRKDDLATEFATRRAALSALIGEEGGNG